MEPSMETEMPPDENSGAQEATLAAAAAARGKQKVRAGIRALMALDRMQHPTTCSCSHPTLDPTPRRSAARDACGNIADDDDDLPAAGPAAAPSEAPLPETPRRAAAPAFAPPSTGGSGVGERKGSIARRRAQIGAAETSAAAERASQHADAIAVDILQLGKADRRPTKLSSINMDEILPTASMGVLGRGDTMTASGAAAQAYRERRKRNVQGISQADLEIRHRELIAGRADTAERMQAEAEEERVLIARKRGLAPPPKPERRKRRVPAEEVVEVAEAPRAAPAQPTEAEIKLKKLLSPPPPRFWWLLLLWVLGGLVGLHRLSLGHKRLAAMMLACVVLGGIVVAVNLTSLHPGHIPPHRYVYKEAEVVANLSTVFLVASVLLWAHDGYLLLRRRLKPYSYAARLAYALSPEGRAARTRFVDEYDSFQDPAWRRTTLIWLAFGWPTSAHRWLLGHPTHALFHVVLNVVALGLSLVSSQGDLETAFLSCNVIGCVLLGSSMLLWLRDLVQLLRGRLGPAKVAAPSNWALLGAFAFGGVLGAHRVVLQRPRSALLYPLLAAVGAVFVVDAASAALTGWQSLHEEGLRTGVLSIELLVGISALTTLLGALAIDMRHLLRGSLKPLPESARYWQMVYSWVLLGLPLGIHRRVADKVSWRLFPVLNVYGSLAIILGEAIFRRSLGDPTVDPSRFSNQTVVITDSVGVLMLATSLLLWLSDLPAVAKGRLQHKVERAAYMSTLLTWLLPSGFLTGLHFTQYGKPLDWILYSSLTSVGTLTAVTARQFARQGHDRTTALLSLVAGGMCIGINLLRWASDGIWDMKHRSLLSMQLRTRTGNDAAFRRIRLLWLTTGWAFSGHHLPQRNYMACVQTVLLYVAGVMLVLAASAAEASGADLAYPTLVMVSITFFGLVGILWLRDGLRLLLGRVDFAGERIEVIAEDEEEEGEDADADAATAAATAADENADDADRAAAAAASSRIVPPPRWRQFKTALGTDYFYDPTDEIIHYLSEHGLQNQAIDSKHNRTYLYDSLADLEEQRRGGPPANLGAAAAAARAVLVASKLKKGVGRAARDAEARRFSHTPAPPPRGQRQQHSDVANPEVERDDPRRASLAPQPPSPTRKCGGKVYTAALEVDQV